MVPDVMSTKRQPAHALASHANGRRCRIKQQRETHMEALAHTEREGAERRPREHQDGEFFGPGRRAVKDVPHHDLEGHAAQHDRDRDEQTPPEQRRKGRDQSSCREYHAAPEARAADYFLSTAFMRSFMSS
jgi:hypothetical protein